MEVYKDDVFDLFVERASVRFSSLHPFLIYHRVGIETRYHDKRTRPNHPPPFDLSQIQYSGRVRSTLRVSTLARKYNYQLKGRRRACKARSVASTNLNRASSRSHAILGITVTYADELTGTSKCSDALLRRRLIGGSVYRKDEPRRFGGFRK
jgi:hypothetical protein